MSRVVCLLLLVAIAGRSPAQSPVVLVDLEHVRNNHGVIRACLIANPIAFPDCAKDRRAIRLTVPAGTRELRFTGVEPGRYAIALFHDENANGKLDTFLGIPREGFGFSRDPKVRFSAPKFSEASITIDGPITRLTIRLQYLL